MKTTFPKVVKGSHLTVTTFEDGSTKLEWDWDALVKDVNEAIASLDKPIEVIDNAPKKKRSRSKKSSAV